KERLQRAPCPAQSLDGMGGNSFTGDLRAQATRSAWPAMLTARINMAVDDFDPHRAGDDTVAPFADASDTIVGSTADRNGE
ncbi:MAG: hypothetical protein AAFP84_17825, partial [Actinomycetota bacterium]